MKPWFSAKGIWECSSTALISCNFSSVSIKYFISWQWLWRMPSYGMWCHVDLVRTNVTTANVVPSSLILSTLKMEAMCSPKTLGSLNILIVCVHVPAPEIFPIIFMQDHFSLRHHTWAFNKGDAVTGLIQLLITQIKYSIKTQNHWVSAFCPSSWNSKY
jgi:hypothetical protein